MTRHSRWRHLAVSVVFVIFVCTSLFLSGKGSLALDRLGIAPMPQNQGSLEDPHLRLMAPSDNMRGRYESPEVWRADNLFRPDSERRQYREPERPKQPPASEYNSMAKYLQQTLVSDYPLNGTEDIFVIIKTGGGTMWERLPVHLFTTMTRVKNFGLYSDLAGSIGGYEVIDVLKDLPEDVLMDDQLVSYRLMKKVRSQGYRWDVSEINFGSRHDGWNNDKFKNLPALLDAYRKSPDSKWFIMIDDDTYIMWESLNEVLNSLNHTEPLLLGYQAYSGNIEHHGELMTHFAHGGSGMLMSKAAVDLVFGNVSSQPPEDTLAHWSRTALKLCCGDMLLSWVLFEMAGITLDSDKHPERPFMRFQGSRIAQTRAGEKIWCEPLVSFHHLTNHEIEILWEYERLAPRGQQLLHSDFYRDFVLPYVVKEREDWHAECEDELNYYIREDRNLPAYDVDGKEIFPHLSKDHCAEACEAKTDCVTWSFWHGTCFLADGALRGNKADSDYKHYHEVFGPAPRVYTGWMVDRIRRIRARMPCDPLEYDESTGQYNDTPETSEGWAVRAGEQDTAAGMVTGP